MVWYARRSKLRITMSTKTPTHEKKSYGYVVAPPCIMIQSFSLLFSVTDEEDKK